MMTISMALTLAFAFVSTLFCRQVLGEVCPNNCICSTDWFYGKKVQCRNLLSIPEDIPSTTKHLILEVNLIPVIKSGAFIKTPSLLILKMSDSEIREIHQGAFRGLRNLTYLYISDNKIKNLPPGLFEEQSKLKFLELMSNQLEAYQQGLFKGLNSLVQLTMTKNKIKVLGQGALEGLQKLDMLFFSDNLISDVQAGAFRGPSAVTSLHLYTNQISKLKRGVFGNNLKIRKLLINYNRIDKAKQEAWEDLTRLESLSLDGNRIKMIEKQSFKWMGKLIYLYLQRNQIEHIQPGAFEGLSSLRLLSLSENKIVHIEGALFKGAVNLEALSLGGNRIKILAVDSFQGLFNLGYLGLNYNNITTIEEGAFNNTKLYRLSLKENDITYFNSVQKYGLTTSLWILDLQSNKILSLEAGVFDGLPNLVSLTLSSNNFTKISPGAFRDLKSLLYLYVEKGNIESISIGVFQGLTSLRYCYLNENPIKFIEVGALNDLKALTYLSLLRCNLTVLGPDLFKNNIDLRYLRLAQNNITTIQNGTFKNLKDLYSLTLTYNKIEVLESGAFKGLQSLKYLFLEKNKITRLETGLFNETVSLQGLALHSNMIESLASVQGIHTLKELTVENNRLKVVKASWFKRLRNLNYLILIDNRIEDLEPDVFKELRSLERLGLHGNNISHLHVNIFSGLSSLKKLFLNDNKISVIQPGLLKGLSSLETLVLANNKISNLFPNTFQDLQGLWWLNLTGNQLKEIRHDHLKGLRSLTMVTLGQNEIRNVSRDAFQENKNLEMISLWRNRLTSIPEGTFRGLIELQHVILQDNQLSLIPDCGEAQIKQLFLVNNEINTLPPMALNSAKDLTILLLDNNNLERIQNYSFYGVFKLKTITLSKNPIKVMEEGAFLSLPNLETVNLLETELLEPLKIWPLAMNVAYYVSSAIDSTFTIQVLKGKYQDYARLFLSSLGYICTWESFLSTCKPCNRGTFKSKFQDICEVCPAGGFYQDEMAYVGATSYGLGCKQCPPGTYVKPEMVPGRSQTDCQSCPQGTDFKEVAKFRACKCLQNYYRIDRFGPCTFCTKGYVCDKESVDLAAGFFWVWATRKYQENYEIFKNHLLMANSKYKHRSFQGVIPQAYACPLAESCLGGILSKCAVGYTGLLCAVCQKGYFPLMTKCRRCPSPPWIIAQIVMALLAVGFVIFVILWEKKNRANDSSRSMTDIFLARLKIVIGFYQVSSSTFDSFSYISWPGPIVTMMRYLKFLQSNLLQIIPLNCLSDKITINEYSYFVMSITMTAMVIMAGFLVLLILNYRSRKRKDEDQLKQYKEKCYRCLFLILFMTFPSTCGQIIKMLPVACHVICSSSDGMNCKSYLRADYSIECNTAKHSIYGGLSIAALTYCIGFPIFIILVLKRGRLIESSDKKSQSNSFVIFNGIRFLYENYSPSCWFWEVVELVRKILFTSLLILLNAESRTSLGLTAIASGFYSVLFALHKPIKDGFEHWLQLTSLIVTSVNFTIGMLMKIPQEETSSGLSNENDSIIITVLLVAANIAVIIIITVKYASSIIQALIHLKKEPQCSAECCLEILQVVSDAHGDMSGVYTEPTFMEGGVKSNDTGISAVDVDIVDTINSPDISTEEQPAVENEERVKKAH